MAAGKTTARGGGKHKQSWVKVNAPVDAGISGIVETLSGIPRLQTVDSCQGEEGRAEAYVYFYFGDWKTISQFAFEVIAPALRGIDGAAVSVEVFNESAPMGKLTFRAEVLPKVASALKQVLSDRKYGYSGGKGCREPRS